MPTQTEAGKAFEYAVLLESYNFLSVGCEIKIHIDSSYEIAKKCFELFVGKERTKYLKAARAAIKHIVELEPRLQNAKDEQDTLELQIAPDKEGIKGDVRDILFIRSNQNWEIGISAKNNHRAVKHSRLSERIDFGNEWLGLACSRNYFETIAPIFSELEELRDESRLWNSLASKHERFYIPILKAFKKELLQLDKNNIEIVPRRLLSYLIGNRDFYKVIKSRSKTEVQAFNLHGTLNKSFSRVRPKIRIPRLRFPTRIIELAFKLHSTATLILTCDEGWQISFRIHNASSRVEPSLKFDVNLVGHPDSMYANHIYWEE